MSTGPFIKLDQLKQFRSKNLSYSYLVFSTAFLKLEFSVREKTVTQKVLLSNVRYEKSKILPGVLL